MDERVPLNDTRLTFRHQNRVVAVEFKLLRYNQRVKVIITRAAGCQCTRHHVEREYFAAQHHLDNLLETLQADNEISVELIPEAIEVRAFALGVTFRVAYKGRW